MIENALAFSIEQRVHTGVAANYPEEHAMTAKTTLQTNVTDTNGRSRGVMSIRIEFSKLAPSIIIHDGKTFCATGKAGVNTKTGSALVEAASDDDRARIWIARDATSIWED
ncbi:MAG: hypothetical protein DVS81_16550 [Candidatus Accumulibacter meliphilus]|jgi:hypothetical protein|uniref:Uncharacterized protein n=1 Tax=Candidatus Accumulibacter meliphilus TaxID=2211374 RepID=A0A369XLZ7_9PROT|nr:MAG: hypothetical protein DVS81_16550 [Candidatus Accumulibacter meliphilus]